MILQKEFLSAGIDLPIFLTPPLMLEAIHFWSRFIAVPKCIFSCFQSKVCLVEASVVADGHSVLASLLCTITFRFISVEFWFGIETFCLFFLHRCGRCLFFCPPLRRDNRYLFRLPFRFICFYLGCFWVLHRNYLSFLFSAIAGGKLLPLPIIALTFQTRLLFPSIS